MSVNFSFGTQDEYYTPKVIVDGIIPYIDKSLTVWCPFDTEDSEFVIALRDNGNRVIHSHIWDGKDFFSYEPEEYDVIVSNPPYSLKMEVFERLYSLGKPFAMLMGLPILNYQVVADFFVGKEIQFLIFNKRVSYDGRGIPFGSAYFCRGLLPKDLIFDKLPHNNQGKHFVKSRMRGKINENKD